MVGISLDVIFEEYMDYVRMPDYDILDQFGYESRVADGVGMEHHKNDVVWF